MHASSPPAAAGALCITGQRRRLTAASRTAINIETPRVGFSWTARAKKKGVPWSRDHGERKKRARGWRFARARLFWRVTSGAPRGARSIADGIEEHRGGSRAMWSVVLSFYALVRDNCDIRAGCVVMRRVQLFTWIFGKHDKFVCQEILPMNR